MRIKKFTRVIFVVTFLISFTFLFVQNFYEATQTKNEKIAFLEEKGHSKLNNQFKLLEDSLHRYRNFTRLVSKSIQYPLNKKFSEDLYEITNDVFDRFLLVKERMGVFELRLVSEDGEELLKHSVKKDIIEKNMNLRNVSDRYYYQDFSKSNQYIYFSEFDLNVENGVIEKPYVQTLRTMTKVYFKSKTYYLIVNFDISNVMDKILKTTLYEVFLTDLDGSINVHLNEELFFAKQLHRDTTLQKLKDEGFHYITQKKFRDTQYNMVLGIKKSQIDSINQSYNHSIINGMIISFLISLLTSLALAYLMKLNINKFYKKVEDIRNNIPIDLEKEYDEFKIVLEKLESQHKIIMDIQTNLKKRVNEEVEKSRQHEIQIFEQAKMVSMGEMIGNIAHQWRQPLSAITTNVSNIQISIELEEFDEQELAEALQTIDKQAKYLSETINTFRDFLKGDKEYGLFVLQDCIKTALDIIKATLESNYITVRQESDTEPIKVKLVRGELEQVIINIINNAKDAILSNNIADPWIQINIQEVNGVAYISIEDNAGGIPQEIISKVFEPYFTTKHESQGTGLGLHMSYNIITQSLQGKLSVSNTEFGAKFLIELPTK